MEADRELTGKRVAVFGLGPRTGVSLVRFLAAAGARVTACDLRTRDELGESLGRLAGIPFELQAGSNDPPALGSADLVLLSPGVPVGLPSLDRVRAAGIPVFSEVEFAARRIRAPLLAITGSNGKSTSTSLLGHLLSGWGKKVFTGGNLGTPLIEAAGKAWDFVLAEISSFQLEAVETFRPKVGLLLNVSPNHLDRHRDLDEYARMKARLFARMEGDDIAVLNADDDTCRRIAGSVRARVRSFSAAGDRSADVRLVGRTVELMGSRAVSLERFALLGAHNRENAAAAVAAADAVGCPARGMEESLASFRALPHRLEPVGEAGGVRYVNDSKATTPEAAARAVAAFEAPVVLLAGGKPKGVSYEALAAACEGRIRKAVLFGRAAEPMADAFSGLPHSVHGGLREAFEEAKRSASPGDVVLLSPANASFDEFRDYEQRGDLFRRLVGTVPGVRIG